MCSYITLPQPHALTSHCPNSRDTLILLGDLVNKGPQSVQVVRRAQELGALAVRGNHDDAALLKYAERKGCGADSSCEKGTQSKIDVWAWVEDLEPADARWMNALPHTISLPDFDPPVRCSRARKRCAVGTSRFAKSCVVLIGSQVLCVHAGLVPGRSLQDQVRYSRCGAPSAALGRTKRITDSHFSSI